MTNTCPWCTTEHDAVTAPYDLGAVPADGDVSVCIDCYRVSVWQAGALVQPSAEQMRELLADQDIVDVIVALRMAHEAAL